MSAEKCCWHHASFQHAMMFHEDVYCCWCGENRCVSLELFRPLGHGPHSEMAMQRPAPPLCPARAHDPDSGDPDAAAAAADRARDQERDEG